MKKAIAILTVALACGNTLHAQDDNSVRFGIKLAPNMSWIRSDTKGFESDGSAVGYTFGLLSEFPIGAAGKYRFATGLFLNSIGGKYTNKFSFEASGITTAYTNTTTLHLRYVELPLTIKMMTNEIGYMRYYGQIGVSAAANVRSKADTESVSVVNGVSTTTSLDDVDVKDVTSPFKAAIVIGGGLEYNFSGSTALLAGITYNNALTHLLEKDAFEGQEKAKAYADYLELTIGVFF